MGKALETMTTFTTQDRQDAQSVPLTEEEIGDIYWSLDSTGYDGCFSFIEFARAIERAHGIGE